MKKIFIIVNVDWALLTHRKEIAIAAKKEGFDVTIIANNTGKKSDIEKLGLKFIDLPIDRTGMNIRKDLKTFWFLFTLFKREKPNIIHMVGLKVVLWGSIAAKFARIKCVVSAINGLGILFDNNNIESLKTQLLLKMMRFSHKSSTHKVIFQNKEDKFLFQKNKIVNEIQSVMIKGSGIDLFDFSYTPEPTNGKITVLLSARMIVEKGVLDLVNAANLLREEYYDRVRFLLCGAIDSNPNSINKKQLLRVCDGDYISWLGHRSDIKNILINSHIFVLPSYYREGIPKSLIEATAIGRPIITSDSIGCKETVRDGFNGFLIPIQRPDIIAERLKLLIENKTMRIEFGKNSRKIAESNFSIDEVIEKHISIYNYFHNN